MQERRKIQRKDLLLYARVFDKEKGDLLGYLSNITTGGIMLVSERPIAVGVDFQILIELPLDISTREYLDLRARSLWCQRDINPEFYDTGFNLVNVSLRDSQTIERVIRDYSIR
jgi:hypothetical protein